MIQAKVCAVVAHFDPSGAFSPAFLRMLNCVNSIVNNVIVVTTSRVDINFYEGMLGIRVISRPNIGYDFYSYRVGLDYALKNYYDASVLFLNSSIYVYNDETFTKSLQSIVDLLDSNHCVGLTHSRQWSSHIQSYAFGISLVALKDNRVIDWFRGIQPRNSKLELILEYELGLYKLFSNSALTVTWLFKPGLKLNLVAGWRWFKYIFSNHGIFAFKQINRFFDYNPVQFLALEVCEKHGFIKNELLNANPCKIDITPLRLNDCSQLSRSKVNHSSSVYYGAECSSKFIRTKYVYRKIQGACKSTVAVVFHIYYLESISYIEEYLSKFPVDIDIFITTPFEGIVPTLINAYSHYTNNLCIALTENRGRDIAPFLEIYTNNMLDDYRSVLKVHGKRSKYSTKGSEWCDRLFNDLCGSSKVILQSLNLLDSPDIGIVGPHSDFLDDSKYWGANKEVVVSELCQIGVSESDADQIGFFAGSMFWFKPKAIDPLKKICSDSERFEIEKGKQDGTYAHAVERMFCKIANHKKFVCTTTALNGADIFNTNLNNKIPVLE